MKRFKKLPIVEVQWVDSAFCHGWDSSDEKMRQMQPVECRSVGILVRLTRKEVALVMSDTEDQMADGMTIPRSCVRKIRKLR